jgi:D-alanyl-D-alanine carboxypeptidase (penicillin-binding protein 5/6)
VTTNGDAPPGHRPWRFAIASALALMALGGTVGQGAAGTALLRDRPRMVVAAPAASPASTGASRAHLGSPAVRLPFVRAPSAILVDLRTGRIMFAKQQEQRRPIASLAKIMTALLVLQRTSLDDDVVVSRKVSTTPPTDVGLRPGERIQVLPLLYGLLLRSGNDAAVALAEHVSGSEAAFVRLMNHEAASLGLRDTWYASPNGLSDRGYSTVRDLATLTRLALADPVFAKVVSSEDHWIPGPAGRLLHLRNLNLLLGAYPGAYGVKTGYTRAAGDCVVGLARRDGRALIAIELGDDPATHWRDAYGDVMRLFDFGFRASRRPGGPS